MSARYAGGVLLISCLVLACEPEPDPGRSELPPLPPIEFDSATAVIETSSDTFELNVEIAETPEQRGRGLMERDRLPEDAGMIFLYTEPQDAEQGFYMYRTLIPLDIAYLDEEGSIVGIRQMEPCTSPNPDLCRTYAPGVAYSAALEVNRGYLERHGITTGDRVRLSRRSEANRGPPRRSVAITSSPREAST